MPRKHLPGRRAPMRQAMLAGAVGTDEIEVEDPVSIRVEQNPVAVWRPGRMSVVHTAPGQAPFSASVGVDQEELRRTIALALKDQPSSVRRPARVDVEELEGRSGRGLWRWRDRGPRGLARRHTANGSEDASQQDANRSRSHLGLTIAQL